MALLNLMKKTIDSHQQENFGDYAAPLAIFVEQEIQQIAVAVNKINSEFSLKMKSLKPRVSHEIVFADGVKPGFYWKKHAWNGWRRMAVSPLAHKTSYIFTQSSADSDEQKKLMVEFEVLVVELRIRLVKLVALRKALSAFD